jgi:hypothetical protein
LTKEISPYIITGFVPQFGTVDWAVGEAAAVAIAPNAATSAVVP